MAKLSSYQKLKRELEDRKQQILRLELIIATNNHSEMNRIKQLVNLRTDIQKAYWFSQVECDEKLTGFLVTNK